MEKEIRSLGRESDFHDSSLIDMAYCPASESVRVIVSTPRTDGVEELWQLTLGGVLRLDLETLGDGRPPHDAAPPEIYDVYRNDDDPERLRWVSRLRDTEDPEPECVYCIILASSYLRGWGVREALEGVRVICRHVKIERVPDHDFGTGYRDRESLTRDD